MMTRTALWTAALLLVSGTALAQPYERQERRELREDRRELAQDKAQVRDDVRDLRRLEQLLADFDAARYRFDQAALLQIDERVRRAIASELEESKRELHQDVNEVRRDQQEVRHEKREFKRDYAHGRLDRARDDRRDMRDDRRDLKDDVRDARVEKANLDQHRRILRDYDYFYGRLDPASLESKRALLGQLISLARGELHQDGKELREDRRELREDRRELHERRRP